MFDRKLCLPFSVAVFFLLSVALAAPAMAGHPYNKDLFKLDAKSTEAKVVKPGDGVTCSNDFVLENNSKKGVEILMLLGGQPFSKVQIPKNDVKMYDLRKNLAVAKLNGQPVSMDDWAFVINDKDSGAPVSIHCTE